MNIKLILEEDCLEGNLVNYWLVVCYLFNIHMQLTHPSDSLSQPHQPPAGPIRHPSTEHSQIQLQPSTNNNPADQELLKFMVDTLSQSFDLNSNTLERITTLKLSDSYLRQTLIMSIIEYFKQQLLQNFRIDEIEKHVSNLLEGFNLRSELQLEGIEEHDIVQQNQRIYTIKYTDKTYNLLEGKEYFNDYVHLFTILKQCAKQTKNVSSVVNQLLSKIKGQQRLTHACIHHKLDFHNLEISIDQLILELLPEVTNNLHSLYSAIQQQVWSSSGSLQLTLTSALKSQLRELIQSALSFRKESKSPVVCTVDNLIEADLFFPNQKIIVNAIKLIEQECINNDYEVVKVQGCLQTKQQGAGISLRIRIQRVCCKLNFYLQSSFKEIRFKRLSNRIRSCRLGCTLYSLMEINRIQKEPLSLHLRQLLAQNQETLNSQKLMSFHKILEQLQVKEYQDYRSLELSYVRDSSLSQFRGRRELEKYKTQIIRLQPQGLFLNSKQAHEKGYSENKTPRSNLDSEGVFPENLQNKDRLSQKKELYKKEKVRFLTQNNEKCQQPSSISSIHPRFEEDVLEQVSYLAKQHNPRTICKSIDIVVEGLKLPEPELLNSQTTQGECQSSLLRERIYELEESVKSGESQCNTLKEKLRGIEIQLKIAEAAREQQSQATLSQRREKQQIKKQIIVLETQKQANKIQIEGLQKLILQHQIEKERITQEKQHLMMNRIEKTQYLVLQQSNTLLQHQIDSLKRSIKQMKINEVDLKAEIQRLLIAEEQSRNSLNNHQESSRTLQRELQLLKSSIPHQTTNSVIIGKLSTIEQNLKYLRKETQSDSRISKGQQIAQSAQIKLEQEPKDQIRELKVWQNDHCNFHNILKSQKRHDGSKIGRQQKREVCQSCEHYKDKVWQSRKKMYYISLIFIILMFEAITFSFSTHIFQ